MGATLAKLMMIPAEKLCMENKRVPHLSSDFFNIIAKFSASISYVSLKCFIAFHLNCSSFHIVVVNVSL